MTLSPRRLWPTALFLGVAFDFLFWGKNPGVSFAIYVALCLGGGLFVLILEKQHPSSGASGLLLPIGLLAAMTAIRAEPMSLFLAHALTLLLMALLATTYRGGLWFRYSLSDYFLRLLRLAGSTLTLGATALARARRRENKAAMRGDILPHIKAVMIGLLLALPVVIIFASLLSSADPIFARRMNDLISLFRLEKLPEYFFRLVLIALVAYALAGVFLHAALRSEDEHLIGIESPLLKPFLGITEAVTVLGSVLLLFASFVSIQFRYFFGGQANISLEGYTYAEYARRGFGELVTVAFFTLLLLLSLSAITRRTGRARLVFAAFGSGLVALVLVILVSAFQRLLLYEEAYGFSRLRTYTHVFIPWLGALLIAVAALEFLQRQRLFATAALLSTLGFAITLNLLNVDAFIARQNVARHARGEELDITYLSTLSEDAIPTLVSLYRTPSLPSRTRHLVAVTLACYRNLNNYRLSEERPWQSSRLSYRQARYALESLQDDLSAYRLDPEGWPVTIVAPDGEAFDCSEGGYH